MNIYVWRRVLVLERWLSGYVIAVAETEADAIDAAVHSTVWDDDDEVDEGRREQLRLELVSTPPEVYSAPHAECIYGSQ